MDQSLDLAGDLTVTRFGTEVAIVTAKKSGEKFEAAMQSAAFAVPAATTIAAALGRLAPLPSDELGAISKAAEAADARKFDKAFARAFLSKDSVSDDDFPSAYPAIPPHSVGQIVALAMGGAFEASGKFPQSLIFLLRTHLASSHSGEWAAKVVDMCSGPAVKAALLHVQDLGETVVAAALARGLGRKPEGSVELSDAEKEEIVKLALTYPCTRGELVASLRRGLSPDEWAAAWSWIAGKLDAENLEEGEWLWAEVAEPEKKEKEIKKKGKGKKNKERKEKESDDVWLPGPKGEKAMLEKRLAFGLEQVISRREADSDSFDAVTLTNIALYSSFRSPRFYWTPTCITPS